MKVMSREPFKVRVRPHVYKFLKHKDQFGKSTITLTKASLYGEMIFHIMQRVSLNEIVNPEFPKWYTDSDQHKTITIYCQFDLPEYTYNDSNLYALSLMFETVFAQASKYFVYGRMDKFPVQVESVNRFLEIYELDDNEYSFDALKKSHQRWRWDAEDRIDLLNPSILPKKSQKSMSQNA